MSAMCVSSFFHISVCLCMSVPSDCVSMGVYGRCSGVSPVFGLQDYSLPFFSSVCSRVFVCFCPVLSVSAGLSPPAVRL